MQCTNVHNIGIPEEVRGKGTKCLPEEIRAETFPKLGNEKDSQVQEEQRDTTRMNPRKSTPRHRIIEVSTIKENLKSTKRKATNYIKGKVYKVIS